MTRFNTNFTSTAKNFLVTSAAVLVALSAHSYMNAPWLVGGIYMGNRANCLAMEPWFIKANCL